MEQTLLDLYQSLDYDDVYFNVNRLISFFGTTKYITPETWGNIAVMIVNSISAKNKKETLAYYYSKMLEMAYEKPCYYKGYKYKIPYVVNNLIELYGTYTFCFLEISRDLIRSLISWFPFRNRSLYNPPGKMDEISEKTPVYITQEPGEDILSTPYSRRGYIIEYGTIWRPEPLVYETVTRSTIFNNMDYEIVTHPIMRDYQPIMEYENVIIPMTIQKSEGSLHY